MLNVPDDWDQHWVTCPHCERRYHASEGGCDCPGRKVYCEHCAEFICNESDCEWETRDELRLCETCAKEYDETCAGCGDIPSVCGCPQS